MDLFIFKHLKSLKSQTKGFSQKYFLILQKSKSEISPSEHYSSNFNIPKFLLPNVFDSYHIFIIKYHRAFKNLPPCLHLYGNETDQKYGELSKKTTSYS